MGLSKDAIFAARDLVTESVDCPEWGGKVTLRGLTGEELDAYQGAMRQFRPRLDGKGMELVVNQANMHALLLSRCIVDDEGERVFADTDASALGQKNARVLDRLFQVASRLSGLDDDEAEAIEGNSGAATDAASTSISPEPLAAPSLSS